MSTWDMNMLIAFAKAVSAIIDDWQADEVTDPDAMAKIAQEFEDKIGMMPEKQ